MKTFPIPALVVASFLAGCTAVLPASSGSTARAGGAAASDAASSAAPAGASLAANAATAAIPPSLPFITLFADGPNGRAFAAGHDQGTLLQSREQLDAFLASRPRALPASAQPPVAPRPDASVTPPPGFPPPGQSAAAPSPEPWPEQLRNIDFGKYQVLVFVDGSVTLGAYSRITAVVDQGGELVVQTTRWEPPASAGMPADVNARLHVVALPRTNKPLAFVEIATADGVAGENEGGSSVAGGPLMNPKWRAVPNPEVTREKVDAFVRATFKGATPTSYSLEKRTIGWVKANVFDRADDQHFTPESEVWVAIAEGDLPMGGSHAPHGMTVGAAEPRASRVAMLISIEDMNPYMSLSTPKAVDPGMRFELRPNGHLHLGDTLGFEVEGPPREGELTLTLTPSNGQGVQRRIPFKDLATFGLKVDATTIPGLRDVPLQDLDIKLAWSPDGQNTAGSDRKRKVVRDRDVIFDLPMRAMGGGRLEDYKPQAGESAADAFARDMAASDWRGQDLAITSRAVNLGEVDVHANMANGLPTNPAVRVYTVRGRFPKFLVPADMSGTTADEVMTPTRLEIALTEDIPVRVLRQRAYVD